MKPAVTVPADRPMASVALTPAVPVAVPVPYPNVDGPSLAAAAKAALEATGIASDGLGAHLAETTGLTLTSLEEFEEAGARLGHVLQEAAVGDLDGLAELITGDLLPGLGETLGGLLEGELPALGGHSEQLGELLGAGSGVVDMAAALAAPIEWGRGIVETIANLLEAMTLGL